MEFTDQLPVELQLEIAQYLPKNALKNLRLTGKTLYNRLAEIEPVSNLTYDFVNVIFNMVIADNVNRISTQTRNITSKEKNIFLNSIIHIMEPVEEYLYEKLGNLVEIDEDTIRTKLNADKVPKELMSSVEWILSLIDNQDIDVENDIDLLISYLLEQYIYRIIFKITLLEDIKYNKITFLNLLN